MSSETFKKLQKATSGQTHSLSQRMRSSSVTDLNHRKSNRPAQLPPVSPTTKAPPHTAFDLYTGTGAAKSVHNRLAGLNDPHNTTGLFGDHTHALRALPMCVRCGDSPNMCMKCSELECENTLTFYRKTRAAGAATLFTKAFVEAGYSKLIKFVVFRLLKNSCQARTRVRMKKKAVVEKLFGTNLVFLPFNAWKRYTRENVLARKDKSIEEQEDRVKVLEIQNQKLTMQLRDAHHEVDFLKSENRSQATAIHELTSRVAKLEAELARERERVKSLSTLAVPFQAVCATLGRAIESQMEDTGVELHSRAHIAYAYNIADVLDRQTIRTIKDFHETPTAASSGGTSNSRKAALSSKNVSSRAYFAVSRCLSRWVNFVSASAGTRTEPVSGKTLDTFLPPHEDIDDITDLRNGKVLSRVILALIIDRQVMDREKMNVLASQSTCSMSTTANVEQYMYGTWATPKITFDEIEILEKKAEHTMDLLDHILKLAHKCLDIKVFQAAEVFSGYRDWLWHLVMSLMNASIPTISKKDYALIDDCIQSYYQLMQSLSERENLKEHLGHIHRIVNDVYTVEVPIHHRENHEDGDEEEDYELSAKTEINRILIQASQSEDDHFDGHRIERMNSYHSSDTKNHEANILESVSEGQEEKLEGTHTPLPAVSGDEGDTTKAGFLHDEGEERKVETLQDIQAQITRRELQLELAWNPVQYETLGHIVDDMILRREHFAMVEYAARLIDSHHHVTKLRNQVVLDRRKREDGVRMTTDIRQFLYTQILRITDPHSVTEENNKK